MFVELLLVPKNLKFAIFKEDMARTIGPKGEKIRHPTNLFSIFGLVPEIISH